jgi:hypothetical protein
MNQKEINDADRKEYFNKAEGKERECINVIFKYFFLPKGCTNLETTPIGSYLKYDAIMSSGKSSTTVFMEMKNRSGITSLKYQDNFIERGKFLELYKKYMEGYYSLFITEYKCGYKFMWNLYYQFKMYESGYNADGFFVEKEMTADNFDYNTGEKDKLVRYLPYYDASYILNDEYEPCSYKEYFEWRLEAKNAIANGTIKNPDW